MCLCLLTKKKIGFTNFITIPSVMYKITCHVDDSLVMRIRQVISAAIRFILWAPSSSY